MKTMLTTNVRNLAVALLFLVTMISANATMLPKATSIVDESRWIDQAATLVEAAQGAHADAKLFNKDVRTSRTKLRSIMQQSRKIELSAPHKKLHSTLLIMSVLLKSAAACQTAGHIVCPPLLMKQLKTVLKNSYARLDETKVALADLKINYAQ